MWLFLMASSNLPTQPQSQPQPQDELLPNPNSTSANASITNIITNEIQLV
jgi:hypothetical protein